MYALYDFQDTIKKKYKTTCHKYYYTKKLAIKADYTLKDRNNNVVLADSITETYNKTWTSRESQSEAKSNALTDEEIINQVMQTISRKIIYAITPHEEVVKRVLQEGTDPNIKLGITYLTTGRTDQALNIWDQCVQGAMSSNDKAITYYNIGVVMESQGLYRDAFELYSEANALLPTEKLYMESMTRVEMLNKKSGSLRKWKK
ncbi:tetratricopeptide repeat protein [uncultured Desulfobacter sp.]|uniref:tetratricopeptide repeat protein n=1 Tax=uncultured Desulfobacter sp. TaxID=240139 RepID=UPI002AA79163|nr:tetratricopeptide repeat protein [uncultured Desulfobacter sp.]